MAPVSFTRSSGVDARAEVLAASELQLLADTSLELADRYERDAEFMEDEEGRQIALALSRWRRCRGRYFLELSAEAERVEATHVDWARTCVGRPGPSAPPQAGANRVARLAVLRRDQDAAKGAPPD